MAVTVTYEATITVRARLSDGSLEQVLRSVTPPEAMLKDTPSLAHEVEQVLEDHADILDDDVRALVDTDACEIKLVKINQVEVAGDNEGLPGWLDERDVYPIR